MFETAAPLLVIASTNVTSTDFTNKIYFQSGVDANGIKLVLNNCTFKGLVIFADTTGNGVELNNCNFELNDSGYGYVQCMGGVSTFNDCVFNISGSRSMGSSPITKYGNLNLYSEKFNTVVNLNRCNSVATFAYKASTGTNTINKNN